MAGHSTAELLLLHLGECGSVANAETAPYERSIPGIAEAMGVGRENVADRVSLLSSISELKRRGLVEERAMPVAESAGAPGERNVYVLTDSGRERAASVRESVADERVVVANGDREEVSVREADRHLGKFGMVRALAEMTEEGVVYVDEEVGDRFVDREDALGTLASVADTTVDGRPGFVLVTGEAGVGKTTLVEEFRDRTAEFEFAVGRCQRENVSPYDPITDALDDVDGGTAVTAALWEGPSPDGGRAVDEDHESVDAGRRATFYEFTDRLADLVADRPLVLVVEDLQWATPATEELLGYLAAAVGPVPLLVVVTCRAGDADGGAGRSSSVEGVPDDRTTRIELDRLDRGDTGALVERLTATRPVPASFVDAIHDWTGGNPLFVEESVNHLLAEGEVDPDLDVYPADLSGGTVPSAVEETIDARLRSLDDATRDVLEVGALVGETVPWELLSAVLEYPDPDLRERVDLLVDAGVWEVDGYELRFPSAVVRETVLDRIDEGPRRRRHREIAEAIREVYADDLSEWSARVARHYRRAGDLERALEFYRMAAGDARDVYAHRDAIDLYNRALEVAREVDDRGAILDVLQRLGETHYVLGEFDEAVKHFEFVRDRTDDRATRQRAYQREADVRRNQGEHEAALRAVEAGLDVDGGSDEQRCLLVSAKGWIALQRGNYDEAASLFDRELELAEETGEDVRLAKAHHDRGSVRLYTNDLEAAIEAFERAIDLWPEGLKGANTLNNLGIAHRKLGHLEAATDYYERALEVAEEADNYLLETQVTSNLSIVYAQRGLLDRATEYGHRAVEMSERVGDEMGVAQSEANLGRHYLSLGEVERATELLKSAMDRFEAIGNENHVALLTEHMASAARKLGDIEAAIAHNERGVELGRKLGNTEATVTNLVSLSETLAMDGRPEDGLERAEEARDLVDDLDRPNVALDAELRRGMCLRESGDPGGAVDCLDPAVEDARELGNPVKLCSVLNELALAHEAAGAVDAARACYEEALSVAREHGLDDQVEAYESALEELQ